MGKTIRAGKGEEISVTKPLVVLVTAIPLQVLHVHFEVVELYMFLPLIPGSNPEPNGFDL